MTRKQLARARARARVRVRVRACGTRKGGRLTACQDESRHEGVPRLPCRAVHAEKQALWIGTWEPPTPPA